MSQACSAVPAPPSAVVSDTSPWVVVGEDDGREIRMSYGSHGDPAAAVHVLLLHGLFDHKGTWSRIAPELAGAGFHVIAPDLIGFGYSSKPEFVSVADAERYGVDAHVHFLRRFIARLGLDDLVIVGNSLGGGVALRSLCTDWPDAPRVRGLVLEDAAGFAQPLPGYLSQLSEWPGRLLVKPWVRALILATGVARIFIRTTFRHVFHDRRKIPCQLLDQAVDILREPNCLYAYREATRNLIPDDIATFPDRYRDIDVPTLIIWGRDDRIIPPLFGLLFEAQIPGSTLHVFDECGHSPHLEYPVETAVVIRDWMRRHVS